MKELNIEDLKNAADAMAVYGEAVSEMHKLALYLHESGSRIAKLIDDDEERIKDGFLKVVCKASNRILHSASSLQIHAIEGSELK